MKALVGTHDYKPVVRSFEDTVEFIENHKRFGTAFLIFIDPKGFTEIRWDLMERLLSIKTADIFLTFMTPFITLNKKNAESDDKTADTMTSFFGNEKWRNLEDGEGLLKQYVTQISKFKTYVFDIPVYQTGKRKLYDLIIATNSKGANNIISDVKKIMETTSTEMMRNALRVVAGKQRDLSQFS